MTTSFQAKNDRHSHKFHHNDSTTSDDWLHGDQYHNSFLFREGEEPVAALENNVKNEIPNISVSAAQGKYLKLVSVLTGYFGATL